MLKYDAAGKTASKILEKSDVPENIQVNALLALGHRAHFRDRDYDKAEEYYSRASRISSRDPRVLFALADVAAVRRQYKKFYKILKEVEEQKDSLDRVDLTKLHKWMGDAHVSCSWHSTCHSGSGRWSLFSTWKRCGNKRSQKRNA